MHKLVHLILLVLVVVGCSRYKVITTQLSESPDANNLKTQNVAVFRKGEIVDTNKPYQILGKIFVEIRNKKGISDEAVLDIMKKPGIKAGADAFVNFNTGHLQFSWSEDHLNWGSALAIKYGSTEISNQKTDYMIDLMPIIYSDKVDTLVARESDSKIINTAVFSLERLGYSVSLCDDVISYEKLSSMSVENIQNLGHTSSNLIFLITMEKKRDLNLALIASSTAKINAKLIQKNTAEVLVEKTHTGGAGSGLGLLNVIVTTSTRKNAVKYCTNELISKFPSCHNGFKAGYEMYKQKIEKRKKSLEKSQPRGWKKRKK